MVGLFLFSGFCARFVSIMHDIQSRYDIERMVDLFYEKVFADDLLSPVFASIDWPHHKPIMYNFWSSVLLGDQSYQGNPFQKHVGLSINGAHFDRWLKLFTDTIDQNFEGEIATEAKNRAYAVAGIFQHRLGLL